MMSKEFFLENYRNVQTAESIRAVGAAVAVGSAALFATQTITGGVAALTSLIGLFICYGEFELDRYKDCLPTDKEAIDHVKPIQNKSRTLFKLFSGLTLLATPLAFLSWFYGSYAIASSIGLAVSVFGLKKSFDSVNNIQTLFDKAESREKYASLVNPEKQAIADLKQKCAKYPNLLKKMDELTSCARDYPLNPKDRTISDTYAACQRGAPDTLVTLQWVHKKLEKLAQAKGNNKNRIAKKLERKLASPRYSDKFIR